MPMEHLISVNYNKTTNCSSKIYYLEIESLKPKFQDMNKKHFLIRRNTGYILTTED